MWDRLYKVQSVSSPECILARVYHRQSVSSPECIIHRLYHRQSVSSPECFSIRVYLRISVSGKDVDNVWLAGQIKLCRKALHCTALHLVFRRHIYDALHSTALQRRPDANTLRPFSR
jgi:hypothetical protein